MYDCLERILRRTHRLYTATPLSDLDSYDIGNDRYSYHEIASGRDQTEVDCPHSARTVLIRRRQAKSSNNGGRSHRPKHNGIGMSKKAKMAS